MAIKSAQQAKKIGKNTIKLATTYGNKGVYFLISMAI